MGLGLGQSIRADPRKLRQPPQFPDQLSCLDEYDAVYAQIPGRLDVPGGIVDEDGFGGADAQPLEDGLIGRRIGFGAAFIS